MNIYRVTRVWDVEAETEEEALAKTDENDGEADQIECEVDLLQEGIDPNQEDYPGQHIDGEEHRQHDTWEEHRGER